MRTTIFTAEALTKTYVLGEVVVKALRGLDLEIWPSEVVVLLGSSDSGKSTSGGESGNFPPCGRRSDRKRDYYTDIILGIFLKGVGLSELWPQTVGLVVIGAVLFGGSLVLFRRL
jgi:hypothetical protein